MSRQNDTLELLHWTWHRRAMYAVQAIVVPALPASPTEQSTGDYYLPDHLSCETDHVINYISASAESISPEIHYIDDDCVQFAEECPATVTVTAASDRSSNVCIHILLVTLICVVLLLIIGFGVAFLLFFGGFLNSWDTPEAACETDVAHLKWKPDINWYKSITLRLYGDGTA